jgi:predicted transcriptional regulator
MRSFTIAIPDDAGAKLSELARRDFRAPRHEAAALLVEAIERALRRGRQTTGRARRDLIVDAGEVER